jgi:ATP-dependent Clp protease ATP-binding subunit ClpB
MTDLVVPTSVSPPTVSSRPAWLREFESTLSVHPQFLFSGNIRDLFVVPGRPQLVDLRTLLWEALRSHGYSGIISYDAVDGFAVYPSRGPDGEAAFTAAGALLGTPPDTPPRLNALRPILDKILDDPRRTFAVVMDYASRLIRRPEDPGPEEREFFLYCLKKAVSSAQVPRQSVPQTVQAPQTTRAARHSPLIWLADKEEDLPSWFAVGNVHLRSILVPTPVLGDRRKAAEILTQPQRNHPVVEGEKNVIETFARESNGLTLRAMNGVVQLAIDRGLPFERLPEAVVTYRLGVAENPWQQGYVHEQIRRETTLTRRVLGQPTAVGRVLDVIKRASLGLSGAHTGRPTSRPRGVLFFAGPTGVGKTELAKSVAQMVYGDEAALLRFDMSEFSESHAADRLIGAPPGYVGHEAGGQLTNPMRAQPFRVILFDEVDKAHQLVLDKFLQILEDGRLTDGHGRTTYFSESVIIFTSNLGVLREDPETKEITPLVTPDQPFEIVERSVREAIKNHFRQIRRPELLNRIGENIIVFDFIRPEAAAKIFELQLGNVLQFLRREHGIELAVASDVRDQLHQRCTDDLAHGGRGIGNQLEAHFVNPLARALFDRLPGLDTQRLVVTRLDLTGDVTRLTLSTAPKAARHG